MQGWVKLHRSKLNWEWFTDYKTSHLFEYLLLKASHNTYRFRGVQLAAGQLPFGLHKASEETGLSVKMIRTSLDKLKSTNEVAIKTSNQGSVITILKWQEYQIEASDGANEGQARGKQRATTKKVKNVKNVKNIYSKDFVALFEDAEIVSWLKETGNEKIHNALLSEYNKDFLLKEITNAFYWQQENKKRKAGTFLKGWCDRSNDPSKINKEQKLREIDEDLIKKLDEGFFDVCEQD
jgi:predicted transcriptional regulator